MYVIAVKNLVIELNNVRNELQINKRKGCKLKCRIVVNRKIANPKKDGSVINHPANSPVQKVVKTVSSKSCIATKGDCVNILLLLL